MLNISEKLIVGTIRWNFWVSQINCEDSPWKQWSLVSDEEVISLSHAKVYVFSDSVLCLGKVNENPQSSYGMGRQIDVVQKFTRIHSFGQNWWWANGIRVEVLPRIHHIAAQSQSSRFTCWNWVKHQRIFTGRIILMSMFNDISWWSKDNKKECESSAQLVSLFARRFGAGQWSFLGPGSEKKWYSISEDSPQGEWDKMAEKMILTFAESGHPVFRATSPLSRGMLKRKGGGKLSIHYCPNQDTITTVFRTITSANKLSLRCSRRNV